jgi:hypothetical protein
MHDRDPGEVLPLGLLERAPSQRYGASRPAAAGDGETHGLSEAVLLGLFAEAIGAGPRGVRRPAAGDRRAARGGCDARVRGRRVRPVRRRVTSPGERGAASAWRLPPQRSPWPSPSNWDLSGAYLGPFDFLDQAFGLLVPLQIAAAAAGALAGTR